MSDNQNIDPQVEETQTPETPENQEAQKESPKDIRATIEANYKAKLAEVEAKAKAEAERAEKLQAEIEAKNKTVEELAEESKARQQKLEEEILLIKKSAEVEKALVSNGINPELQELIKSEALKSQSEDINDVVNTLKTKYPTAFTSGRPINVGISTPSVNSNKITKEKALEMVNNPTLYKQYRNEINEALRS